MLADRLADQFAERRQLDELLDHLREARGPGRTGVERRHLENVEAIDGGSLAYDEESGTVLPHIHVSVGLKAHSATAHTSHLLGAKIQFLTEMYLVEVTTPAFSRPRQPDLHNVPLLTFE